MFFLFALLSLLGYSLQSTLLAHHARQIDGLSLTFYRNLSLCFSMIPLLFLVPEGNFTVFVDHLDTIVWASISGALALAAGMQSIRFMPVGISTGLKVSIMTLCAFLLGFFFFQESLSWSQIFFMIMTIICATWLSFQKYHFPHFTSDIFRGSFFAFLSGLLTALSGFFMSTAARESNPFLSGYVWEVGIFCCAALLVLGRWIIYKHPLKKISWSEFQTIALISSLTLLGTGGLAYAVTLGPFAIVTTIGSGGILVSSFVSVFLYKEKLKPLQWIVLFVLLGCIVGLRFTTL